MKITKKEVETSKKNSNSSITGNSNNKTLLTVKQASEFLGKTEQTITNWCKSGVITALPRDFGTKTSYSIPADECWRMKIYLEEKKREALYKENTRKKDTPAHSELVELWVRYMEQGMIMNRGTNTNRKPYSSNTTSGFRRGINCFLASYGEVSYSTIKQDLINIPKENFGKRWGVFSVTSAFYCFLIQEGHGSEEEYNRIKRLRPKRYDPAKKNSLNENQVGLMFEACKNNYERALFVLLVNTGIRNSELRNLKRKDLNLEGRVIQVLGKGNKLRPVGLNKKAVEVLEVYLNEYNKEPDHYLFTRWLRGEEIQHSLCSLIQKVKVVGGRESIQVTPHQELRRAS